MTHWPATTQWPADPGHREAIETLLMMAEDEHRCGQPRQAVTLLEQAERIVGPLPERYQRLRHRPTSDLTGRLP
jgi:hypothetical protein